MKGVFCKLCGDDDMASIASEFCKVCKELKNEIAAINKKICYWQQKTKDLKANLEMRAKNNGKK